MELSHSSPYAIREQVIRLTADQISAKVKGDLDTLVGALSDRILASPVRLPSREVNPLIRWANTTIVIQDAQRKDELPLMRMYYLEEISEVESQVEREVRMTADSFSSHEREAWERLRKAIKGIAWHDYQARFAER